MFVISNHNDAMICYQTCQETKRRQQAEAAERRMKAEEGRGVKDPEALKRKQQRKEELEKKEQQSPQGEGLRVCTILNAFNFLQI